MKHVCPHCGQKTFSPLKKALCGGMSSSGKHCPECNGRCVNGKVSLAVHSVLLLIAFGMIIYTYFTFTERIQIFWTGLLPLLIAYAVGFVFDMFFGKLIPAIKIE